jgi:hypothetical protein
MKLPRIAVVAALAAASGHGQNFTQRGSLDVTSSTYPESAASDDGHIVAGALLRYEAFYKISPKFRLNGGFDFRTDTHRQVAREVDFSWADRQTQQAALAVRRLSLTYTGGPLTIEAGKQFIRWGKADILNPTDRFAPQDYSNVVQADFLGVTGVRVAVSRGGDSLELVGVPIFTPSRTPLLNQRWVVLPQGIPRIDGGARYPHGLQFGARWNHTGAADYSLSYYDGFSHLPLYEPSLPIQRYYPQMRMYGGDFAIPFSSVTIKGEAGYFTSTSKQADEYLLYVLQLERQQGEWSFTGGYAGEVVTERRNILNFAPDRGLARSFLGRAAYTLDANRSIAIETAIRQNGKGVYGKFIYSHAFGQHVRATAGMVLIGGEDSDFLGQYHRNSYFLFGLRYSF